MKVKNFIEKAIWVSLGTALSSFLFEIRFNNPILRRELLIIMGGGGSYFSMWVFVGLILAVFFFVLYLYSNKKIKTKK